MLANSIKKQARCVAGREILPGRDGVSYGGWIRPVSSTHEGALFSRHYTLVDGEAAAVLDIVDIPLLGTASDPGQPENWCVDEERPWRKLGTLGLVDVESLRQRPRDLWLAGNSHRDRISATLQAARDPQCSLVLIKPVGFRVRMWREFNPFKNYTQRKTHAVFSYRDVQYSLSLTDPVFCERRCRAHPPENAAAIEVVPPCEDTCLLCVSLTPPFNGYHYKVVATVLELV